eukprot:UC4_evm3s27
MSPVGSLNSWLVRCLGCQHEITVQTWKNHREECDLHRLECIWEEEARKLNETYAQVKVPGVYKEMINLPVLKRLVNQYPTENYLQVLDRTTLKNMSEDVAINTVSYHRVSIDGVPVGRSYASNASLQWCPAIFRGKLAGEFYHDIDMANSIPAIMLQIAKKHRLETPCLREYVENRDVLLQEVRTAFSCTREVAKTLFIILLYGGRESTWRTKNNLRAYDDVDVPPVASGLRRKFQALATVIRDQWEAAVRKRLDMDMTDELLRNAEAYVKEKSEWEIKLVEKPLELVGSDLDSTSYKYFTSVIAENGKIYAAPYRANQVLEIDPTGNEVATRLIGSDLGSGVGKYFTSVIAGNGKIYAAPYYANQVLEVDPTGNEVATRLIGTDLGSGVGRYRTSVVAGNGKIYAAPSTAHKVLEIDPTGNEVATRLIGSDLGSGVGKYFTSVIAGNGKIYAAPYYANQVLEIDPTGNEVATRLIGTDLGSGVGKYFTSVIAGNGKIYAAPSTAHKVLEIDPTGDKVTTTLVGSDLGSGVGKYFSSVIAGNGKIYAAPSTAHKVLEIDPTGNKVATALVGTHCGSDIDKFHTLVHAGNGKIYAAPRGARYVLEIDPAGNKATTTLVGTDCGSNSAKYWTLIFAKNGKMYAAPSSAKQALEIDPGPPYKTPAPTKSPSTSPSKSPSASPTRLLSTSPRKYPSVNPTKSPSTSPTKTASVSLSKSPSTSPSKSPSASPSKFPSTSPSKSPYASPSKSPSTSPTKSPPSPQSSSSSSSTSDTPIYVGIGVGAGCLVIIVALFLVYKFKTRLVQEPKSREEVRALSVVNPLHKAPQSYQRPQDPAYEISPVTTIDALYNSLAETDNTLYEKPDGDGEEPCYSGLFPDKGEFDENNKGAHGNGKLPQYQIGTLHPQKDRSTTSIVHEENAYMEPVSWNPNHDSTNASHYNVIAPLRNKYPKGLIEPDERKEKMKKMLEEEENSHFDSVKKRLGEFLGEQSQNEFPDFVNAIANTNGDYLQIGEND